MKKQSIILFILTFFYSLIIFGQNDTNDPTFNTIDFGFGNGDGAENAINAIGIQSDEKIILGGGFIKFNGKAISGIVRVLKNGSIDSSFKIGQGLSGVNAIAIQKDGKIIVGGSFNYNLLRLNTDGTLDTSFKIGKGPSSGVEIIKIQSDGKIIIGGGFSKYNDIPAKYLARINPNGSLDTTFKTGSGPNNSIRTICVSPDYKVIIGGDFTSFNGTTRNYIARLLSNGSIDTSFKYATGANNSVQSAAIQPDEKIIIGGYFTTFENTVCNKLIRLNKNGSIDTTFKTPKVANGIVSLIEFDINGKIVVNGGINNSKGLARLNQDGSLDVSFNTTVEPNNSIYTAKIQADNSIVIGGNFNYYSDIERNHVVRLKPDGNVDITFIPGTGANNTVLTSAIQNDGKIVIGGSFTLFNGKICRRIARLTTNGDLDTTFKTKEGTNNTINALALQKDGKIVIAGTFTSFNGTLCNRLARINTDGSLDNTFKIGSGINGGFKFVSAIAIQDDGKIILGGNFSDYNGKTRNHLVRINSDGSLDSNFNKGKGPWSDVRTISLSPDGKIIIGGYFQYFDASQANRIARLNTDGSLDNTFNTGSGINTEYVMSTVVQSDGKIIAGGSFNLYNGNGAYNIVRINSDGSKDNSFDYSSSIISKLALQKDGKILVGRGFLANNNLIMLNNDGTVDNTLKLYTGANSIIYTISVQDDNKIIIGGNFTDSYGSGKNRIARINGNTIITENETENQIQLENSTQVFPNPNNGTFTIKLQKEGTFNLINNLGQTIKSLKMLEGNNTIEINEANNGIYFLKSTSNRNLNFKIIISK